MSWSPPIYTLLILTLLACFTQGLKLEYINHTFPVPVFDFANSGTLRNPPANQVGSMVPLSQKFALGTGGKIIVDLIIEKDESSKKATKKSLEYLNENEYTQPISKATTQLPSVPDIQGLPGVRSVRDFSTYYVFSLYTARQFYYASNDLSLGSTCNHPSHLRYVIPQNGTSPVHFKFEQTVAVTQLFWPVLERCRPYFDGKKPNPIKLTGNITFLNPQDNHLSWNLIPVSTVLVLLAGLYFMFTLYNFKWQSPNLLSILLVSTFFYGLYFSLSAADVMQTSVSGTPDNYLRGAAYIFLCLGEGCFILFSILLSYGLTILYGQNIRKDLSLLALFFGVYLFVQINLLPCYLDSDAPPSLETAANVNSDASFSIKATGPVGAMLKDALESNFLTPFIKSNNFNTLSCPSSSYFSRLSSSITEVWGNIHYFILSRIFNLSNLDIENSWLSVGHPSEFLQVDVDVISTNQTLESVSWCRFFSVAQMVLSFLVIFGIIFSVTTRIERLHQLIVPSGADSRLAYIRLKIYYRFRWSFLLYLLIPVIVIILSFSVFSWIDFWFEIFVGHVLVLFNFAFLFSSSYLYSLLSLENSGRFVTSTDPIRPPDTSLIKKLDMLIFPNLERGSGSGDATSGPEKSIEGTTDTNEEISSSITESDSSEHTDESTRSHGPGVNFHSEIDFQANFPYYSYSSIRKFLSFFNIRQWS